MGGWGETTWCKIREISGWFTDKSLNQPYYNQGTDITYILGELGLIRRV